MNVRRVVPDILCERLEESREFYTGLLGFRVAMDMGWIVTLVSPSNPTAQINLGRREPSAEATGPLNAIGISIEVENVDEVHAKAVERGVTISYPLTDEPWGVRRFFMVDPNGVTLNVMCHNK
jgi:catechol 2,3-dioxygenase-like lactoylglutathione lyase family enzyme